MKPKSGDQDPRDAADSRYATAPPVSVEHSEDCRMFDDELSKHAAGSL